MRITIDLPEEAAANLRAFAQAQGRSCVEIAAEVVEERYGANYAAEEFALDS